MEEAGAPKEGEASALAPDDPLIGTVIADRYRVEARVGEGGMGSVYRVEHTHMRKRFALKVLHADLSNYEEVVARFEREAMAAANIEHPNIASATDFGKLPDGTFYLVLEYV
jgi:serine/threonine-protein kinase